MQQDSADPQLHQGNRRLFRLPELQRRELAVPLVQHPVPILIQGRQLAKTVAGAGPEQLAAIIYGTVAVAIQRHEAAPLTQAGQAVRLAILIDVEIDPGVGQAGYLAVQAEHQRILEGIEGGTALADVELAPVQHKTQIQLQGPGHPGSARLPPPPR